MAKKKVTVNVDFEIGETVYLKKDNEQIPYFVIGFVVQGWQGEVVYQVRNHLELAAYYGFELTKEKVVVIE